MLVSLRVSTRVDVRLSPVTSTMKVSSWDSLSVRVRAVVVALRSIRTRSGAASA